MKIPYQEGTVFAIPLRRGGFGLGVAARIRPRGCVVFGYFFGPKRDTVPPLGQVGGLCARDAAMVGRFGDLAMIPGKWPRNTWPLLGQLPEWQRDEWPMPPSIRRDPLSRRAWLVQYSETDLNRIVAEEEIDYDADIPIENGVMGCGYVEIVLTKILDPETKR